MATVSVAISSPVYTSVALYLPPADIVEAGRRTSTGSSLYHTVYSSSEGSDADDGSESADSEAEDSEAEESEAEESAAESEVEEEETEADSEEESDEDSERGQRERGTDRQGGGQCPFTSPTLTRCAYIQYITVTHSWLLFAVHFPRTLPPRTPTPNPPSRISPGCIYQVGRRGCRDGAIVLSSSPFQTQRKCLRPAFRERTEALSGECVPVWTGLL